MFDNTTTFTDIHGTDDYVLNRISESDGTSNYRLIMNDRLVTLRIRNSTFTDKKRQGVVMDQHNVELVEEVFSVTPGLPSYIRKAFFTFQVQRGDNVTASKETASALALWLLTGSGAAMTKLVNGEC